MTTQQQWSVVAATVMTVAFGVVLAMKIRPQMDLIGAGSHAPNFTATDLRANRQVTLTDYAGKVVLVNIWATWCDPCRLEMPSMERLSQKLAGTDFRILAVSVDKDPPDVVMKFANDLGLHFDILQDRTGAVQGVLQTTGVPESFVIDRNGVVIKKIIGAAEWDAPVNETLVRRLLDGK